MKAVKQLEKNDILSVITAKRICDISRIGYSCGCSIPERRTKRIIPFLPKKGVILEIKRASPSRGDIAPSLNAAQTAAVYEQSGAAAISVLTERNFFKGSLDDLIDAAKAAPNTAILRKDFLTDEKEIDIAFRCGADAVLLIARILETDKLVSMVEKCRALGITALIEVRLKDDIAKLQEARKKAPENIVIGVNARDLSDFSIDLLKPASLLEILGKKVIFESGIRTPRAAELVSGMGFHGLLLGEGAAKHPKEAQQLVDSFCSTGNSKEGAFWVKTAAKINREKGLPLVKICGLTQKKDAVLAADLGADFEGFIFSNESKRCVSGKQVEAIVQTVKSSCMRRPCFVGVITDPSSKEAEEAYTLVQRDILDVVQFHGCPLPDIEKAEYRDIPYYPARNIGSIEDIQDAAFLLQKGCPRILIDAKVAGTSGGTGKRIDPELVKTFSGKTRLWLAGGITPENAAEIINQFNPELIDISSGIEKNPGIKDPEKMKKLFEKINNLAESRKVLNPPHE